MPGALPRPAALLLLLLALGAPAVAQPEDAPQPSFLVHHATGGRDPDPLATALSGAPGVDRLPATLFDRAARADPAPESAPESAPAHYREMERILSSREAMGAPTLTLRASVAEGVLRATVGASAAVEARIVLFEHGAPLAGVPQPYVARFATDASALAANGTASFEVPLAPSWEASRLGVVAIASANGSVVQSATWLAGDDVVVQRAKGVLVEHVTASWCDACKPADEALALLALQRGAGPALGAGELQYLRAPPSWPFYAGLGLGALGGLALLRRRAA